MSAGRRLPIDGGSPVRTTFLPYAHQQISDEDVAAVVAALRSDWLTTGPRVPAFEAGLAEATGARHAVAFSSGTAALHGAAVAAGLGTGGRGDHDAADLRRDGQRRPLRGRRGALRRHRPGDAHPRPGAKTAAAITARTKAMLPVDYAGHPADYAALRDIADAAPGGRLTIIADASHSLGATRDGQAGRNPRRHDHPEPPPGQDPDDRRGWRGPDRRRRPRRTSAALPQPRHRHRARGPDATGPTRWSSSGYNYRLTDIGAALGSSQLERLGEFLARRRELAAHYLSRLSGHPYLDVPVVEEGAEPAWHFCFAQLRLDRLRVDRGVVYKALRAEGIGVNVHYIPVHQHPYYRERYPGLSHSRWRTRPTSGC